MRRMPCGGSRLDWLLELADRAGTRATVGVPGKWDVDLVAPEIDNVRAVLDWALSTTPSAASPWPRRSRDSGSFASRARARHVSSHCSHEPRTPSRSFAATRCGHSAVRSSSRGDYERAAPCYRQSLELFVASGDEIQTANLRYRVAANMIDDGRDGRRLAAARGITPNVPAARPPSRRGPGTRIPRGEASRRRRSGARDRADRSRAPRSPTRSTGHGGKAASSTVPLSSSASGNLDAAEGHALGSLELSLSLGNRRSIMLVATKLAVIAAERAPRKHRRHTATHCASATR